MIGCDACGLAHRLSPPVVSLEHTSEHFPCALERSTKHARAPLGKL
jgi:hypothetical protein